MTSLKPFKSCVVAGNWLLGRKECIKLQCFHVLQQNSALKSSSICQNDCPKAVCSSQMTGYICHPLSELVSKCQKYWERQLLSVNMDLLPHLEKRHFFRICYCESPHFQMQISLQLQTKTNKKCLKLMYRAMRTSSTNGTAVSWNSDYESSPAFHSGSDLLWLPPWAIA